jgi:hypothetical protein
MNSLGDIARAIGDLLARREADDAEHWGRVHMVAAALSDANLDDDDDVVRALYAVRFRCEDFFGVLDDAIAVDRERRATP